MLRGAIHSCKCFKAKSKLASGGVVIERNQPISRREKTPTYTNDYAEEEEYEEDDYEEDAEMANTAEEPVTEEESAE